MANTYSPIWKDKYFETASDATNYKIIDSSSDKIIDEGYTKIAPGQTGVSICLNNKIDEYVTPYLDYNGGDFSGISDMIVNNTYAIKKYAITYDDDQRYQKFGFLYDWSYRDLTDESSYIMSEPINGHLDPRQKLMQTQCEFKGEYGDYVNEPLTFSAITSGSIRFRIESNDGDIMHSPYFFSITVKRSSYDYTESFVLGGKNQYGNWRPTSSGVSISAGDTVQVWGVNIYLFRWDSPIAGLYYYLNIAGGSAQCKVYGNLTSLFYGSDFNGTRYVGGEQGRGDGTNQPDRRYFQWLFANNYNLYDVTGIVMPYDGWEPIIPDPFSGCTNLTYVPISGDEFALRTNS